MYPKKGFSHNAASRSFEKGEYVMNIVIACIIGGVTGLLASIFTRAVPVGDNILVGICGSLLTGLVFIPLLGMESMDQKDFSLSTFLVCLTGAAVLLAVNAYRRACAP
jgi:uncharacterized membrane protein YeaQ/YmgE (transglycosylase-associated protein family)